MKNLFKFLFLVVLMPVMTACQDQIIMSTEEGTQIDNQEVSTRMGAPDETSISNPDLIDNWENVKRIVLNKHGEVDAPWNLSQGHSISIPEGICTDVKKKMDGVCYFIK
ncbi:MAG: hypothetical protein LUE98_04260 [Tannerellaceae bacterium]|nr:hypothetical protein [Tannerellaceae bacterium]